MRPPKNTGSKAGAQTFGLDYVTTPYTMTIDADTTLAPNAMELILPSLRRPGIGAVCGVVLPRAVKTIWERGCYIGCLSIRSSRTTSVSCRAN